MIEAKVYSIFRSICANRSRKDFFLFIFKFFGFDPLCVQIFCAIWWCWCCCCYWFELWLIFCFLFLISSASLLPSFITIIHHTFNGCVLSVHQVENDVIQLLIIIHLVVIKLKHHYNTFEKKWRSMQNEFSVMRNALSWFIAHNALPSKWMNKFISI